jgi:hypothetical protein
MRRIKQISKMALSVCRSLRELRPSHVYSEATPNQKTGFSEVRKAIAFFQLCEGADSGREQSALSRELAKVPKLCQNPTFSIHSSYL